MFRRIQAEISFYEIRLSDPILSFFISDLIQGAQFDTERAADSPKWAGDGPAHLADLVLPLVPAPL